MITNTGKEIIAKYLIGQAPAFASYLAFGCGEEPLKGSDAHDVAAYAIKDSLTFEMFRSPIISRGYVTEGGVSYIVFTSELPTEERYEITEIGVYSAGSNASANANNSRVLFAFTENENWEYHTETASTKPPKIVEPLHDDETNVTNIILTTAPVFQTNANNLTFSNAQRNLRYEKPRFLNNAVILAGDVSDIVKQLNVTGITATGTKVTVTTTTPHKLRVGESVSITGSNPSAYNLSNKIITEISTPTTFSFASTATGSYVSGGVVTLPRLIVRSGNHIHLATAGLNLSKNSPEDEIRLAFSVMSRDGNSTAQPSVVRLILEFSTSDASETGESARLELNAVGSELEYDFETNRYYVASKKLEDLSVTNSFNWSNVSIVKIFATILDGTGTPTDDFFLALDAVRLENLSTFNALYGLTGYTVVKNTDGNTVLKDINTSNLAEFRFAMDVS
jgi:hypothetical protein